MNGADPKSTAPGLELVKKGDLKGALSYFEEAGLWFEAGKIAQKLDKPKKAIEFYVKAKRPLDVANIHLSQGNFLEAAEYFVEAQAFHEQALAIEQWLAKKFDVTRINATSKSLGREVKGLVKQLIEAAVKGEQWEMAGLWSYASGDKIKAADYYLKSKTPGRAAPIYEEHKRFIDAGKAWTLAKEHQRAGDAFKNGELYVEAGNAYALANAYEAAVTCYRRAKRLDLAGNLALNSNKVEAAAQLFLDGKSYFEAAQCFRKLNQFENLQQAALRLAKKDPNYNKASLLAIDAAVKLGTISFEVDDFIKEFLTQPYSPKTLGLFFDLAKLYEGAEFYEVAEQIYSKISTLDPAYQDVQERLRMARAQMMGSPLAVKKVMDEDFGYKKTSERLVGYQQAVRHESAMPVPSASPISMPGMPETSAAAQTPEKLDATPGSVLFSRYRVVKALSQIGATQRLRVVDQEIDDEVDLKILDVQAVQADDIEQYRKAIKLTRKDNSPYLLPIYDYGKKGEVHFVTTEALSDEDLATVINREGRMSLARGTAILIQVAQALEALHQHQIIHRDLNPQNVHLLKNDVVKVREFALATQRNLSQASISSDEESGLLKRLVFMAPEQIEGKSLSTTADIYSLGVLMYELFTEQLPFDGKELKGLIYQQLHDAPTPPRTINPGIPENLESCILKCMAKTPKERYPNTAAIIELLREVGGHRTTVAVERPKVINERYEIKGEIGRGGMGIVYRAHDRSLQRDVALKFLPHELSSRPDDLNLFLNEARSAARLSHNNIVTIHNIEKFDKEHFIVMEFIDGVDIHNLLETMEKLPFKSIDLIGRQVCEALEYAHKRKVFHRDIKCANILWTNDKVVKITDFGLAKIVEGALVQSTRVQGSPAYMSPEQILGKNVDHRTDLYSFGVALYEMATGTIPFAKGDISYHQLHTEPTPAEQLRADIPEHLKLIIQKCLRKSPDERFQNAAEILTLFPK